MRTTLLVCFIVLILLLIRENDAIFSEYPVSQNVSLQSTVVFTCAVPNGTSVSLSWIGLSGGDVNFLPSTLSPDGVRSMTATLTATERFNNTNASCDAGGFINGMGVFEQSPSALLLIQGLLSPVGNLTSTAMDHCTLRLTWTAPYTLQGVPVLNYTIVVNADTDDPFTFSSKTTEYLYTPNALGVSYTIIVTASNKVGPGAGNGITVDIPTTAAGITIPISIDMSNIQRASTAWLIPFTINNQVICTEALSGITFTSCLTADSCVVGNSTAVLPSAAGTNKTIVSFDLLENRKYTASMIVLYNGGVEQQSQSVEISTFDVLNVRLNGPVMRGTVCLNVTYVEGHELPAECYIVFRSSTTGHDMYNATIQGSSMCIPNVPVHPSYTIIATDGDAVDEINTTAPVTILGVVVPEYTVILSNTAPRAMPTPTELIIVPEPLSLVVVIVIPAFVVVILTGTIIGFLICVILYHKKEQCCTGGTTESVAGATNPPPVPQHVSIDPLPQSSVQTAPSYENIPAVSPQSNDIEMKKCPAYNVITEL